MLCGITRRAGLFVAAYSPARAGRAATAGRHPELNGGIFAWALDVTDGSIVWKSRMSRYPTPRAQTTAAIGSAAFYLPAAAQQVTLSLYTASGRRVGVVYNGPAAVGNTAYRLSQTVAPQGLLFTSLEVDGNTMATRTVGCFSR